MALRTAIAVGLLAACQESTGGGTTPTQRTWGGDFLVDTVLIDCNGVDTWTYDVTTIGWGEVVTVDVVARDLGVLWHEHHELSEVDWGDGWARFQVDLEQVFSEADYQDSQTTWIACEAKSYVTYGFATWRYDGEMDECIAYGVDPVGEFPDCANWGQGH